MFAQVVQKRYSVRPQLLLLSQQNKDRLPTGAASSLLLHSLSVINREYANVPRFLQSGADTYFFLSLSINLLTPG